MAIAQRFQPRNLAESRFNPFYGEMPELPRGSSIKRVSSPIQGESNTFTSDPRVPSWTGKTHNLAMVRPPVKQPMTEQQRYQDLLNNPIPGWDPRMNNPDYVLSQMYNQGPRY